MYHRLHFSRTFWTTWLALICIIQSVLCAQQAKESSRRPNTPDQIQFPVERKATKSLLSELTRQGQDKLEKPAVHGSFRKAIVENDFRAESVKKSMDSEPDLKSTSQYPVYHSRPVRQEAIPISPASRRVAGGKRVRIQSESGQTARKISEKLMQRATVIRPRDVVKTTVPKQVTQPVSVLETREEFERADGFGSKPVQSSELDIPVPARTTDSILTTDFQNNTYPTRSQQVALSNSRMPSDLLLDKSYQRLDQKAEMKKRYELRKQAAREQQENIFKTRIEELAVSQQAGGEDQSTATSEQIRQHIASLSQKSNRILAFANEPQAHTVNSANVGVAPNQSLPDPGPAFESGFDQPVFHDDATSHLSRKPPTSKFAEVNSRTVQSKAIGQSDTAIYANLSDVPGRLAFRDHQDEPALGNVNEVESETIARPPSSEKANQSLSPTEIWMKRNSKYNWSTIKPSRKPASSATQTNTQGWRASFRSMQQEELNAESEESGDLPLESDLETEAEQDGEQNILMQRNRYRSELYEPMSNAPVARALMYLDDKGTPIPLTKEQKLHLVGFNSFYHNVIQADYLRTNHRGDLWVSKCATWKSPDLCYQPLYYEDVNLERFGARFPVVQPAASALHFFASTVRLPYKMALDPFWECQYVAGFGRPGNRYCYQRERLTWDLRAGSFQALLATGLVFALP